MAQDEIIKFTELVFMRRESFEQLAEYMRRKGYEADAMQRAIAFLDEWLRSHTPQKRKEYQKRDHALCIKRWVLDAIQAKISERERPRRGNAAKIEAARRRLMDREE